MFFDPSKEVAVPVAPPDRVMVRAAASFVAVPALPVHESAVTAVFSLKKR